MARIVKITDKRAVDTAVAVLRSGGVVIIPTETSYGVAVDATNKKAVERIFRLKKRSRRKALPVIVSSVAMARKFFILNETALKLCRFFPAPLTLIVRKKRGKLAANLSRGEAVAFRVPRNAFCRLVARRLKRPITATSANISGKTAVFSFTEAKRLFAGKVNLIVDGGKLKKCRPSTVVNCVVRRPTVVRRGNFGVTALFLKRG